MPQDSLGNNVPFQGGGGDFAKALIASLKSPVQNTSNKTDMDFLRQSMLELSHNQTKMQKALERLSQENKKIISSNAKELHKIAERLNTSLKNSKKEKKSKEHIELAKLAHAGLKKGSIYTHDIRTDKHLNNITKILKSIHQRMKAKDKLILDSYDEIGRMAERQSKSGIGGDVGSGNNKQYTGLKDVYKDAVASLQNAVFGKTHDLIVGAIGAIGAGDLSTLGPAFGEGIKFYDAMAQTALQVQDISAKFGGIERIEKNIKVIQDAQNKTGLNRLVLMKNYVKLTRMGMKDSQQAEKALTASGRAAFELGMDADSTAELFGQWTQELGLGDRQITAMTRSMRDTARTTGLMGDSLAKAVHSSKVMMDYLRNINSLTSSSADNVLKLTAAGQKFGVGEQVGEFQKLLAGGPARAAMGGSKYFTLFQRILDKSGLRGKFNAGEDILGDEKLVAQFGKGLEKEFAAFEKMSKQGQAVFAHSMGMEIGELKQVVKAWKESISGKNMEDIEKKIKAQKDVLANAEKLGNKLQINAAKDQLFGLQSQHVDKILRDQTTAFDKRGAKGVSDAELQKAADEINEMAKGAGLGTQLEPGALAGKSAEEKLQLLENTNEQVRAEISKMRSPQQQANQWLEKIYDWLAKFGTGAAPNIHPAVAFGAGIFGKQLASWGLNAGRALWNGRAGAAGAEAAGAGGAGVRGAAGGVRGAAGAGGVRGAAAGAGGIRGAGGAAGAGSRFGRAGAALGRGLGAAGRGLGGVGRVAMGAGKLAGRLATPVAMALGAYEGAATSTNDWDARRPENLKDWGGWDYASKAGDIASMSTGDFVQIGKRQYESYQSNAAVRKTESERKIDKMGMADRQKQLAGLDDPKKLEELQNQKANLTRLRGGAENNIKQLEKNKGSWFNPLNWWANNSDNAMIEGDKGRITAYDKELKDIDDQLGKMSAATSGASIDTLREERAAQAKADVESESTKQLTDVASNTGSAVDALTSMQTTLSEILEELRTSNTSPDTSPNAKGSVAPDYGRQVSNTRSGSINRNMSYTQQT